MPTKKKSTAKKPARENKGLHRFAISNEQLNNMCDEIRLGCIVDSTLKSNGVSRSTFYKYLTAGRELVYRLEDEDDDLTAKSLTHREKAVVNIATEIDMAIGQSENRLVSLISIAAQDDWRAADRLLSRRFPNKWGDRQVIDIGHVEPEGSLRGSDDHLAQLLAGTAAIASATMTVIETDG